MKVLVEEIYDGDAGAPYARIVIIGSTDEEIANFTVIETYGVGADIEVKWEGGGWANFQK